MNAIKINRYQPSTLETKLYTEARAARILGIKTSQIEFVVPINPTQCLIGLWNDSVIVEKSEFVKLLVGDRRQRSNGLKVTKDVFNGDFFRVRNDNSNSLYLVSLESNYIKCECKDWENQSKDFNTNQVACKHAYAVLNTLGYNSLREYIKDSESQPQELEYSPLHMGSGHY